MRIAITADGDSPDSFVDSRFTTAWYVLAFDPADGQWEAVKFSLWSRRQKYSGQSRAGLLAEKNVGVLITGGVNPVSFRELGKRGITIFRAPDCCLVREAAQLFAAGRLPVMRAPDAVDVTRLTKRRATIKA